jgi:phosphoribosyl 1,2-cyclic phosphodiesterase
MNLAIQSIGSSSSGNSYLITDGTTHLLLDVGLSGKKIREALAADGISEDSIQGILVTHEHVDHVKSIRMMSRICGNAEVVASRGTAQNCENFQYVPKDRLTYFASQSQKQIGDITVRSFALSHDAAEPIGFSFCKGDTRIAVVTDTGVVTDEIYEEIRAADVLVMEANHEVEMLQMGPYPYSVKRRILSDVGHLSNVACGETLSRMLADRGSLNPRLHPCRDGKLVLPKILLAHLSTTNNTPYNAALTVQDVLDQNDYHRNVNFRLDIAAKAETGELIGY